jgi:hypothetical protein
MQTIKYSPQDEQLLMQKLWSPAIKDNPEAFVMLVFPWGEKHTPLENFRGPRKWQREVLRKIADHIKANSGRLDPQMLRMAIASGRGIGKSALVAWITMWFMSTRIGSSTIISANSEAQLRSVTWAEIIKWSAMAINSHWYEVSATRIVPAKWISELVERDLKKGTRYWAVEGRLWSEENPDGYAGLHNYDGVLLIFDESSGIPDSIWQVAAGFFSEPTPHRFWCAFSNPRRNSGYFFECFNAKRAFWNTQNIDARTVEDTDKGVYQTIIDEYGEDSPQAMVEVYGEFPGADEYQFIPLGLVEEAAKRPPMRDPDAPVVVGVDPARFGADATIIVIRKGRDLLEVRRFRGDDTMTVVGHVIEAIEDFQPALTVIDEGGLGAGVLDRLLEQRYKVRGVNFGWKAKDQKAYQNKRAEIWGAMKQWLRTASLKDDRNLKKDLCGPRTKPNSSGAIALETKEQMKSRGLASPDAADALACTFAFPLAHREYTERTQRRTVSERGMVSAGWMAH